MDFLVNQKSAAERLGLSVRTLEKWRCTGDGSQYIKMGRLVRYRESDLNSFINNGVKAHTSQVGSVH